METNNLQIYYDIATQYQPLSKQEEHELWVQDVLPFKEYLLSRQPKQLGLFGETLNSNEEGIVTDEVIRQAMLGNNPKLKGLAIKANNCINKILYHNMQIILSVIKGYSRLNGVDGEDYIVPCLLSARRAIQRYKHAAKSPAKIGNWIRCWVDGTCKKISTNHIRPCGEFQPVSLDDDESLLQIAYEHNDSLINRCLELLSKDEQNFFLDYLELANSPLFKGRQLCLENKFNEIISRVKTILERESLLAIWPISYLVAVNQIKTIYNLRTNGHSLLSIAEQTGLAIDEIRDILDEAIALVNMGSKHTLDTLRWEDLAKVEMIYRAAMSQAEAAEDPSKYLNCALRAIDTRAKMLHYYATPPETLAKIADLRHDFIDKDIQALSDDELEGLYGSFLQTINTETI